MTARIVQRRVRVGLRGAHHWTRPWPLLAALAIASIVTVVGCSPHAGASPGDPTSASELTVFAAASLKEPLTALGQQFEASHPGVEVKFSFAGSSDLLAQLGHGAPADLFAAADQATMSSAVNDGLTTGEATDFASNSMIIAVPPDNPARIATVTDLARSTVRLVTCAPQVPCGASTAQVANNSDVTLHPVSQESSVTDVLNKVTMREADAGVVYVTDVKRSGTALTGIPIPPTVNVSNTYSMAAIADAPSPALAEQFRALVVGPEGQRALADAGFNVP